MQQETMTRRQSKRENPEINSDASAQSTEWQRRQDERDGEVGETLDTINSTLASYVLSCTVSS